MPLTGDLIYKARKIGKLSRRALVAELNPRIQFTEAKLIRVEAGKRELKSYESEAIQPIVDAIIQFATPEELHNYEVIANVESYHMTPVGTPVETGKFTQLLKRTQDKISSPIVITIDPDEEGIFLHDYVEQPAIVAGPSNDVVFETPVEIGVKNLYAENGNRRLTNSELQTFKHCRRRWWLGWYRGLTLKQQKFTGALSLGTRVHQALAEYYVPGYKGEHPSAALEKIILDDEQLLIANLNQSRINDSEAINILGDFKKEADLARRMIEGYMEWLAETGADQGYEVLASEQQLDCTVEVEGPAPDIQLSGVLDARIQSESDSSIRWIDHKTTANMDKLTKMLIWDEQMLQYRILEECNKDDKTPYIGGAIYNMLKKVKRSATARPPFYQRIGVHHNRHQLDSYRQRLVGEHLVIHQVEEALANGVPHQFVVYPSPSDRCTWGCEFSAVCPLFDDHSRAEDFVAEHYTQMNPLSRYDKGKNDE